MRTGGNDTMRTLRTLGLIGGFILAGAVTAGAHTPCCATYNPCEEGEYAKADHEGDPAKAQCCHTEEVEGEQVETCQESAYAGHRCSGDIAANASAIGDRGAVAGCVEGDHDACIGGAITAAGANGCAWISGFGVLGPQGVVGSQPNGDWNACVANAVKHCCDNGACEFVGNGGGGH